MRVLLQYVQSSRLMILVYRSVHCSSVSSAMWRMATCMRATKVSSATSPRLLPTSVTDSDVADATGAGTGGALQKAKACPSRPDTSHWSHCTGSVCAAASS
eukprot:1137050-Rhodomonas_salina.2